jgi:hypothetical protein
MAGPVPSIDQVPLRDVLPPWLRTAEQDLRRSAHKLDRHPSAVDRIAWHWYPEHTEAASTFDEGNYLLLADTTITLLNTGDDWLELTLDIAWRKPPQLTVNAAVEVACWCPQDHNLHQVRATELLVASDHELIEAFAAGTAMLTDVLESGPFDPRPWRIRAGLPDAPTPAT